MAKKKKKKGTGGGGAAAKAAKQVKGEENGPSSSEVMDDMKVRFLLSIPEEELLWDRRVFFQLEQAHWFYEDFYADRYANIKHMKLKGFSLALIKHAADLFPKAAVHQAEFDKVWNQFRAYKGSIPVFGGALLNSSCTKILLVNNWSGACWGFPRGKVNQGEDAHFAAVRETHEETGYDASAIINPTEYGECASNVFFLLTTVITLHFISAKGIYLISSS